MSRIRVYCDGGCSRHGAGGWAVFIETPDGRHSSFSGYTVDTTNNRMELTAAIQALLHVSPHEPATIICDSQYVVYGITRWIYFWQKRGWISSSGDPVANRDLWEQLDELRAYRDVQWSWVKGHARDPGNIEADRLASLAREVAERL